MQAQCLYCQPRIHRCMVGARIVTQGWLRVAGAGHRGAIKSLYRHRICLVPGTSSCYLSKHCLVLIFLLQMPIRYWTTKNLFVFLYLYLYLQPLTLGQKGLLADHLLSSNKFLRVQCKAVLLPMLVQSFLENIH